MRLKKHLRERKSLIRLFAFGAFHTFYAFYAFCAFNAFCACKIFSSKKNKRSLKLP